MHACTTTFKKFPFDENFKKKEKLSFVSYEKVLLVSSVSRDEQYINKKTSKEKAKEIGFYSKWMSFIEYGS